MAAFADPSIGAVLATIGGDDQITLLPFLDPAVVTRNPKPFVGYSDNTNLLNWLWNLGVAGYHGGSTMVHLGRGGGLHPVSTSSLRAALIDRRRPRAAPGRGVQRGRAGLGRPGRARPRGADHRRARAGPGTSPTRVVTAPTWGGNLEILHWNLAADRWIRPVDDYAGCILLLETSEEMPSGEEVFRMLRNMGERGLLAQFPAVAGRHREGQQPRAPASPAERDDVPRRAAGRRAAALDRLQPRRRWWSSTSTSGTPTRSGSCRTAARITVDGPARTITAHY